MPAHLLEQNSFFEHWCDKSTKRRTHQYILYASELTTSKKTLPELKNSRDASYRAAEWFLFHESDRYNHTTRIHARYS